jgi:CRP/FNR family transcriptional regulator, cyclic AMP receptor protein
MWPDTLAYLGMVAFLLSYAMDGIIKLRVISIMSSGVFLIYGIITVSCPTIIEQLLALPVNGYGLYKMIRLIRQSREAAEGYQTMEWLKPYSTKLSCATGQTLFHLGDPAEDMYCITSGTFRLVESGMSLRQGAVVGELGFLSPGNKRTQTLHCEEAGILLRISYDSLKELYFQNPNFGFYFLRLVSERLFQNHAAAVNAVSAA